MEGDKPLMVTPVSIGVLGQRHADRPLHRVTAKDPTKRSGEYGFWVNGSDIYSGSSSQGRSGYHYVGYPMANWVEFAPGYGFHEGYVWPVPRSHGCLRLDRNASVKFSELVHVGTPVTIANSLPYDDTIGRNIDHPTDYRDPDPARFRDDQPRLLHQRARFGVCCRRSRKLCVVLSWAWLDQPTEPPCSARLIF